MTAVETTQSNKLTPKHWALIGFATVGLAIFIFLRVNENKPLIIDNVNPQPSRSPSFQAKIDNYKKNENLFGIKNSTKNDDLPNTAANTKNKTQELIGSILGKNDNSSFNKNEKFSKESFMLKQEELLYESYVSSGYSVIDNSPDQTQESFFNESSAMRLSKGGELLPSEYVLPMGSVIHIVSRSVSSNHYLGSPFFGTVMHDVYDYNRNVLLINKGASVIGEIQAVLTDNPAVETKLGIIVKKIKRADGSVINFDLPASDTDGLGGITGEVNKHSFRKWGGFAAFAVLSSGLSLNVGDGEQPQSSQDDALSRMKTQVGTSASAAANQFLAIKPTVTLNSGDTLSVMIIDDMYLSALGDIL